MRLPKIFTTIQSYNLSIFVADLLAGATVAMVALPLSLAIAIASGADPAKGVVTAIVAGLLISLFGGSRVQIGGPTGAFIVVVFGVIAEHGYDGLVLATFMAGIILLVAGDLPLNCHPACTRAYWVKMPFGAVWQSVAKIRCLAKASGVSYPSAESERFGLKSCAQSRIAIRA